MGDMGDIFREMRESDKQRREENLERAQAHKHMFKVCTEHHWQYTLNGELLDYYPTRCKWRYRNKNRYGDVVGFIRNIETRRRDFWCDSCPKLEDCKDAMKCLAKVESEVGEKTPAERMRERGFAKPNPSAADCVGSVATIESEVSDGDN
jgi:hypothetical protein